MGSKILVTALLVAAVCNVGGAEVDKKGKATTADTKKGGSSSSSSSSSKSHFHETFSSKGSGKTKETARDSNKENKGTANAVAAPLDNSKAGLASVEVDLITGLERDGIEAGRKRNRNWFQSYLAEDFSGANADGVFEDKTRVMARALDPANVVESKTYDELNVRAYGEDVMIATGRVSEKGRRNNVGYDVQRTFTHVWVNRFGQWQQVAVQESPIQPGVVPGQPAAPSEGAPSPAPSEKRD